MVQRSTAHRRACHRQSISICTPLGYYAWHNRTGTMIIWYIKSSSGPLSFRVSKCRFFRKTRKTMIKSTSSIFFNLYRHVSICFLSIFTGAHAQDVAQPVSLVLIEAFQLSVVARAMPGSFFPLCPLNPVCNLGMVLYSPRITYGSSIRLWQLSVARLVLTV
jgi:hypothetical protein